MSPGSTSGSIATATVRARSKAEMPVVTPVRASIETVNAVRRGVRSWRVIIGRPSRSTWAASSGRQIRPRPCRAMKLIACGVANAPATTRSPSFSRFSSSTMMTISPRAIAATAACSAGVIARSPSLPVMSRAAMAALRWG